jgi:hypothetical protein
MPQLLHCGSDNHPGRIGGKRRTLPRIAIPDWRLLDSRTTDDLSHKGYLRRSHIGSDKRSRDDDFAFQASRVFVS